MKQIAKEIIDYSRVIFETSEPFKKHTLKNNLSKPKSKSKTKTKIVDNQNGGDYTANRHNFIKIKQRRFGVLKSYKIKLIIKKGQEKDSNDITDLSYNDTYNLIMKKLVDPDILITFKISYSIKYINLIIPYSDKSRLTIIFSDTKIIYPNIHNPYFFSYYFMNNKNILDKNIKLENLVKQNISISDIINTKHCKNNCRFISVKCLQVDIIYMLKFAELLEIEDLPNGIVLVPVESLFKYYKYMIKFIRVHIIKKFFNGTLANNKLFQDSSKKLIRYIEYNIKQKTSQLGETLPINIIYKNIIRDFHQAFFINKTMFPEYDALNELVTDYNSSVYYINKSCALFKSLDDEDKHSGESLESISIQHANKQLEYDISKSNVIMNGGVNKHNSKKSKIILHENFPFEDIELDNKDNDIKTHKINKTNTENQYIIDKLYKMLKNEIQFINKLSTSIRK